MKKIIHTMTASNLGLATGFFLLLFGFYQNLPAQNNSRIELKSSYSPALGLSKNFNIYLPRGYDDNPAERYPVVYLFRGHEREWANPNEDLNRNGRNIQDIADYLHTNGLIGRMILVMPGLSSEDNVIPGLGVNFVDVTLAGNKAGIGTGQFEDYLRNDLIPHIDENFRTLPYRSQRGVDGFSLGGYTAMMLAARHPDLFSSAGAYDGTMMWLDLNDQRSPGPDDDNLWLANSMFNPAFGFPRNLETMLQYNPANLIKNAESERLALLQSVQFLIHCAGSEPLGNFDRSQHMVALLAAQGIQNGFETVPLAPAAQHNWWYADEHMLTSLPRHWNKFQNPVHVIPLKFIAPVAGHILSGVAEIKWSPGSQLSNMTTTLFTSQDNGATWQPMTAITNDTTYLWNTENYPDGTRYRLRALVTADSILAFCQTNDRFTINNPGNAMPDVELLAPKQWDLVTGMCTIRWFADDADGDRLTFSIAYSSNNGINWQPIVTGLQNTNDYTWNTVLYENSLTYRLCFQCQDGFVKVSDTSGVFIVDNERSNLIPPQLFTHVAGSSGAKILAHVVDSDQLTGNLYRITFDDTRFAYKVYDVLNIDTGEKVVESALQMNGFTEGPLFDGIRLLVADLEQASVDQDNTGWTVGSATLDISVYLKNFTICGREYKAFPYPADYSIKIFDHVVDTSSAAFGAPQNPMMFEVKNLTETRKSNVIFIDKDRNQALSRLDYIYILEPDPQNNLQFTWTVFCGGDSSVTVPKPGDEFIFRTLRPLTAADVYEFRAMLTAIEAHGAKSLAQVVTIFPNYPNPFNPVTTIEYALTKAATVELDIFNLRGQHVTTLVHKDHMAGKYHVEWNGTDQQGHLVAAGVYFYQLTANSTVRIGKMIYLK